MCVCIRADSSLVNIRERKGWCAGRFIAGNYPHTQNKAKQACISNTEFLTLIGLGTGSADPMSRAEGRDNASSKLPGFAPFDLITPFLWLSHTHTHTQNISRNKIKATPPQDEQWSENQMTMSKEAKSELSLSQIPIIVLRQHINIFIWGRGFK